MSRWPIIRHVRALYLAWQLERWARQVRHIFPFAPNPSDVEYLRLVWRGEA